MENRKHFFDNGKALASILGFFYHTGLIFSVTWAINVDPDEFSNGIYLFTQFLTIFRMPLFMFISGYFAMYAVKKYEFKPFANRRLMRLGIPLISTLFTFVFIQKVLSKKWKTGSVNISSVFLNDIMFFGNNFTLSHLWFLYIVIIFSFALYLIVYLIKPNKNKNVIIRFNNYFKRDRIHSSFVDTLIVTLSVMLIVVTVILNKILPNHALLPIINFGIYLPYFVIGALTNVYYKRYSKIFFEYSRKRFSLNVTLMSIALVLFLVTNGGLQLGFSTIAKYYGITIILFLLHNFMNFSKPFTRYLSDSSYSIYLLHQPVIVSVSYYYLKHLETNTYVSFVGILMLSIALTYLLDFLIVRSTNLGRLLYTGVR